MLAGHYQTNKEGLQKKKLVKGIMIFLKNRTIKSLKMFVNNIEVYMKKRKKFRNFYSMANSLEILKNFWNSFY